MSLKKALEALKSLGLTDIDAHVYVYLAKKGSRGEKELADALKLTKQQLGGSITRLLAKGMVSATSEGATKYVAVALEKVLDQIMKAMSEQACALQESRGELLAAWRAMIEKNSEQ